MIEIENCHSANTTPAIGQFAQVNVWDAPRGVRNINCNCSPIPVQSSKHQTPAGSLERLFGEWAEMQIPGRHLQRRSMGPGMCL